MEISWICSEPEVKGDSPEARLEIFLFHGKGWSLEKSSMEIFLSPQICLSVKVFGLCLEGENRTAGHQRSGGV
nr:hypothetical protein Iba_chr04eCG17870 [Ipomoea batatas]